MFSENLTQFFDLDEFAVEATIKTAAGATVRTVNVIFNTPQQAVEVLDAGVEAGVPFVECRTSDLDGVTHKHTMTISSVVYRVVKIDDDGTGVSTVQLRKQ
ncbi:MAG TPA: hypothetical protein VGV59_10010 [Pyrinomonadaceae bacterium]|nr:hypothetical protein [Pyrinomonadaceae bacterium]